MKKWIGIAIMITAIAFMLSNLSSNNGNSNKLIEQIITKGPSFEYGILTDSFSIIKGVVKNGQTLGEILYTNHIDHPEINTIVNKSKEIFDVRSVNAGRKYTVMCATDSTEKAQYCVYEIDATNYVVFDLRNDIDVYKGKKQVTVKLKKALGTLKSSL